MATQTIANLLSGPGGTALLPRKISNEVWSKATAQSIVPSLVGEEPFVIGENVFPVLTERPSAYIVGEAEPKTGSNIQFGAKTARPVKAVVGVELTLEAITVNPVGALGRLTNELSGAIARQIDLAVFHGRVAATGAQISGVEWLAQATKRVELTTPNNTDAELWAGYGLTVNNGYKFNGFAFDPRLVYNLGAARDVQGRRLNPDIQIGDAVTSYSGQRVSVSETVSGNTDKSTDTLVRGFGGDWSALKFGHALDLFVRRIDAGDPLGNGDLGRRNAVAFIAETIFGWAVMDLDAFVVFEQQAQAGS